MLTELIDQMSKYSRPLALPCLILITSVPLCDGGDGGVGGRVGHEAGLERGSTIWKKEFWLNDFGSHEQTSNDSYSNEKPVQDG